MGIGIDIVEIDKIGRLIERWEYKFLNRVFTDRELVEWEARGKRLSLLAGKFATKEAFFKANKNNTENKRVDAGLLTRIRWKEIEVVGVPFEPPSIWVRGQKIDTDLSISHTSQIAVSVVLIK